MIFWGGSHYDRRKIAYILCHWCIKDTCIFVQVLIRHQSYPDLNYNLALSRWLPFTLFGRRDEAGSQGQATPHLPSKWGKPKPVLWARDAPHFCLPRENTLVTPTTAMSLLPDGGTGTRLFLRLLCQGESMPRRKARQRQLGMRMRQLDTALAIEQRKPLLSLWCVSLWASSPVSLW